MYFDYCHQILYKSVVPFSRFSIFTKRCQKVQLPAALTCLFPACSDRLLRKRSTFFPLMLSVGISSLGHTKVIFIEGKWFVLPDDYAIWGILQERVYRYQIGDVDHLTERLIYELCHFDQPIIERAVVQ